MVTRIWHGKTKASDADAYLAFLLDKGTKDYLATPGNIEVKVWRKIKGDIAHFWTVSTWDNLESITAFAGDEVEKARYYPEDDEFLLDREPTVIHCETFNVKS